MKNLIRRFREWVAKPFIDEHRAEAYKAGYEAGLNRGLLAGIEECECPTKVEITFNAGSVPATMTSVRHAVFRAHEESKRIAAVDGMSEAIHISRLLTVSNLFGPASVRFTGFTVSSKTRRAFYVFVQERDDHRTLVFRAIEETP